MLTIHLQLVINTYKLNESLRRSVELDKLGDFTFFHLSAGGVSFVGKTEGA
jgi:hypothetical protein